MVTEVILTSELFSFSPIFSLPFAYVVYVLEESNYEMAHYGEISVWIIAWVIVRDKIIFLKYFYYEKRVK